MVAAPPRRRRLKIQLHPAQKSFRSSDAPARGFVGGRGAGKSFVGAYDLIARARRDRLYLVTAPTYPMLRDSSIRTFAAVAKGLGLWDQFNRSDLRATLATGAEILFRSADEPDRLRGPNLSGCWMDEASQTAHDAFLVILATLREGGERGWLSATFTPRGRHHWTYDVFGAGRAGSALFHASTADNPFLPPGFEQAVRAQYTSAYAEQELAGRFVDLQGGLFRREWFGLVDAPPGKATRVRYWDKAGTEDGGCYTAGVLVARASDGTFCVEDVARGQWSALAREERIRAVTQQDRAARGSVRTVVEQEPGSGGKESAEATVRHLAGFDVRLDKVTGDKVERAQPFAAQCEAGNVKLVAGPWNEDFLEEMAAFPEGPFKDQADAACGAFNHLAATPVMPPVAGAARPVSAVQELAGRGMWGPGT